MANATFVAAVGGDLDFSDKNSYYLYAVVGVGVLALIMAGVFRSQVLKASEGTEKMQEIGQAVQEGAAAYLSRQFRTLAVFAVVALGMLVALDAAVLGWDNDWKIKIGRYVALLAGAGFSALIGYLGMWLATRANIRVAAAAQNEGREVAMRIAFRTGGTVGMLTVGLGLIGAGAIVLIYTGDAPEVLEGFGFGAALLAMFMRVGGGIFTKAADVGADLVGKVEQNIPEDDPRNAATIADNVGDNVGDCAGMAADLFESYAVTLVAALILGSVAFGEVGLVFPLVIPAIGALTAILGVYITRPRAGEGGLTTINRSFSISAIMSAAASVAAAWALLPTTFNDADLPGTDTSSLIVTLGQQAGSDPAGLVANPRMIAIIAVLIGIVLAAVILALTGYFTGTETRPVKDVGKTSLTGAATVILSGLSVGFESAVYTAIVIGGAVFGAFLLGSGSLVVALFAVALAGCGLLTTVGVIVAMDTFGPVSDNAQGIAEMSGDVDENGAQILTELDAVGNTTKAITKGIAIATAVLAATALFGAMASSIREAVGSADLAEQARGIKVIETYALDGVFNVADPSNLFGLILGAAVVFLFSGLAINAVGRAAGAVVYEVRRQFREIPGIMEGTGRPEYGKVVDICTRDSLRELATPGILAIFAPIAVGFGLGIGPLGAYLAGAIGTGLLMAVFLANSGGAWDNAKKLVEDGNHGGKGSPAHEATIIGDTVGDPFKDTAGPAINPLLKVMNLVALLATPLIIKYSYGVDASEAIRYTIAGVAVLIIVIAVGIARSRPIALDAGPSEIAAASAEMRLGEDEPPMDEPVEACQVEESMSAEDLVKVGRVEGIVEVDPGREDLAHAAWLEDELVEDLVEESLPAVDPVEMGSIEADPFEAAPVQDDSDEDELVEPRQAADETVEERSTEDESVGQMSVEQEPIDERSVDGEPTEEEPAEEEERVRRFWLRKNRSKNAPAEEDPPQGASAEDESAVDELSEDVPAEEEERVRRFWLRRNRSKKVPVEEGSPQGASAEDESAVDELGEDVPAEEVERVRTFWPRRNRSKEKPRDEGFEKDPGEDDLMESDPD